MLDFNAVTYSVGNTHILHGVSFDVEEGGLSCLLGPSGGGKTSILRLIAGLDSPKTGTISLDGKIVSSTEKLVAPHKRDVGFLFQDFALFPHLTVAQNISYGLTKLDKYEANKRTEFLLDQIRLSGSANRYPHMLSGGEQQRTALARAIASKPRVVLLDEPFSNLDTSLRTELRDETLELLRDQGVTTVMVTHDPDEAMSIADKIVLINDGTVVQTGKPAELYNHPVNKFAASFFGNINKVDGTIVEKHVETDIGTIPVKGYSEGSKVDLLVRPEGIKILSASEKSSPHTDDAWVCGIRYRGDSSLVRVGIGNWPQPHTHVEASQPQALPLQTGDKVYLDIDIKKTFIFPKA